MGIDQDEANEHDANDAVIKRIEQEAARQRVPGAFDIAFLSGREDVTELLIIRHGQQSLTDSMSVGELNDPPLSQLGESQARLVGMRLSTERIDHVYASPLRRARETGLQVARHHRLEPVILDDLKEVEVFRDLPPDKTPLEALGRLKLAGARQRMISEKSWDVYPFSESSTDFRKRIINAIEGIIATHPGERVAVACHGGVINAYIGHVIGSRYDMFFRPAHTSVNVVAGAEGIRALYTLNDITHLRTAEGEFHSV
ncbi:MAG: histidine phosphatase family protein [Chloroflexi bacterium]|nr:histidine phosphatase family protein [Chloroflexota bacterium]